MKQSLLVLCPLFWLSQMASAQHYLPWVVNNPQFTSRIEVINPGQTSVQVVARATQPSGESAFESFTLLSHQTTSLEFPTLKGQGYSVSFEASAPIVVQLRLAGTASASGDSPAQLSAISQAADQAVFGNVESAGFTAIVVAPTLGTEGENEYIFTAFKDGAVAAETALQTEANLPIAVLTSDLFPAIDGPYWVGVRGSMFVGAKFIFNDLREPSMSAAIPVTFHEEPQPFLSEIEISTTADLIFEGDEVSMVATGTFDDGTQEDISQQVVWEIEAGSGRFDENILTIGNQGNILISANLDNIRETFLVEISRPTIVFERQSQFSNNWSTTSLPFVLSAVVSASIIGGDGTYSHGKFRMTAKGRDFLIQNIVAEARNLSVWMEGPLQDQPEYELKKDETIEFELKSALTGGQTIDLHWGFETSVGDFTVDVRFRSN